MGGVGQRHEAGGAGDAGQGVGGTDEGFPGAGIRVVAEIAEGTAQVGQALAGFGAENAEQLGGQGVLTEGYGVIRGGRVDPRLLGRFDWGGAGHLGNVRLGAGVRFWGRHLRRATAQSPRGFHQAPGFDTYLAPLFQFHGPDMEGIDGILDESQHFAIGRALIT